jgi:stage V sporulation protein R
MGRFGREWEQCDDFEHTRGWDMQLGLGREKIFQVRALYNDVTFIDEFLTPEFVAAQKLYTFGYSGKNSQFEIESRQFKKIKDKLLFQLTNFGNPIICVVDPNFANRGELLLRHDHQGVDLQKDYAQAALEALVRCWKRPCAVATKVDKKPVMIRYDGSEHTEQPYKL